LVVRSQILGRKRLINFPMSRDEHIAALEAECAKLRAENELLRAGTSRIGSFGACRVTTWRKWRSSR
jgi:hypothetical protein